MVLQKSIPFMHRPSMELGSSSVNTSSLSRLPVKKGVWSAAEDVLLRECIEKYGIRKWSQVPSKAGLNRCRKSCRLRWLNYLQPSIKRGEFQPEEVDLIIRMHKLLGNRWSLIAGRIPGRTANDIKNYYNTHLKKTRFSNHNVKGKNQVTIIKKISHKDSVRHDDQQVAVERRHPSPNSSTSHMTSKVIRPLPRTFPPTYKWISNEATTSTSMNHNNMITTTIIDNNRSVMKNDHEEMIKMCLWSKSILFNESKGKEVEEEDENREEPKNQMVTINSSTMADDIGNSTGFNVEDRTMKCGTNEDNYWDDLYLDDNLYDVLGDLYAI